MVEIDNFEYLLRNRKFKTENLAKDLKRNRFSFL